jgi:hypothetical protein
VCVVVSAPNGNSNSWVMRRSVEVLSFHRADKEVRVLLGLFVQNKKSNNVLGIMHQSNVDLLVHPAWPFPRHPDERGRRHGILDELYGGLFREDRGRLYQTHTLTAWDENLKIAEQEVRAWAPYGRTIKRIEPDISVGPHTYVPFTTWTLGPFPEVCSYLITFELQIKGPAYQYLVAPERSFTVDGPERLLSTFRYGELPRVHSRHRDQWRKSLDTFEKHKLLIGEGYDIVVLRPPLGDAIEFFRGGMGIAPASIQPSDEVALRFTTVDQSFSIGLRYASSDVGDLTPEIVAYR